jgi:hypothetical protein
LQYARATALAGDSATARKAYQNFFELWKQADSALPFLAEAHQDYDKLK